MNDKSKPGVDALEKENQETRLKSESADHDAQQQDDQSGIEAVDSGDSGSPTDSALADAQAKADKHWDLYLRAAAELENVRKRAARDVENAHKFAVDKLAAELLSVKDSLELGLAAASEADDIAALRKGKEATLKLLEQVLEKFSIVQIDPQGEPFDPEWHEAMAMQPTADQEPGSVLQVVQKGYQIHGRLLRPARVIVAREAEQAG